MVLWAPIYLILYFYRVIFTALAQLFVSGVTKRGDSGSYTNASIEMNQCYGYRWLTDSTCIAEVPGVVLHILGLGNELAVNIIFSTVAIQLLASVTVTAYVPGSNSDKFCVVSLLDHRYS